MSNLQLFFQELFLKTCSMQNVEVGHEKEKKQLGHIY